jgi:hypothetical protein
MSCDEFYSPRERASVERSRQEPFSQQSTDGFARRDGSRCEGFGLRRAGSASMFDSQETTITCGASFSAVSKRGTLSASTDSD